MKPRVKGWGGGPEDAVGRCPRGRQWQRLQRPGSRALPTGRSPSELLGRPPDARTIAVNDAPVKPSAALTRILVSQRPSGRRVWASWGEGGFEERKGKAGMSLDCLLGPERKGEGQRAGGARAGGVQAGRDSPEQRSVAKRVREARERQEETSTLPLGATSQRSLCSRQKGSLQPRGHSNQSAE